MKRTSEFSVGLVIVIAVVALVVAGLWLGQVGPRGPKTLQVALFRTVGGVKVGDPVVLRGVKVGRVEAIRLAKDDWVETDLRMTSPDELPPNPIAIAASASLFGEWQVAVMDSSRVPNDPELARALVEARHNASGRMPGATLPDVGQLTAQASRIASDIAVVTNRVSSAFDSQSIVDIRSSVRDLRKMADRLVNFTQAQTTALDSVVNNASTSSTSIVSASKHLQATLERVDSSTASGELSALVKDARAATADIRSASSDFKSLASSANSQRDNLTHILTATDVVLTRLEKGQGTLGMMSRDSTLYLEMTKTVVQLRSLLADVQANPRRYFRFSVF